MSAYTEQQGSGWSAGAGCLEWDVLPAPWSGHNSGFAPADPISHLLTCVHPPCSTALLTRSSSHSVRAPMKSCCRRWVALGCLRLLRRCDMRTCTWVSAVASQPEASHSHSAAGTATHHNSRRAKHGALHKGLRGNNVCATCCEAYASARPCMDVHCAGVLAWNYLAAPPARATHCPGVQTAAARSPTDPYTHARG